MAEPSIDIDRVVREVLVQLGLAPDAGAAGGQLVLNCRVVTLAEVEGRLEAVRRLVVPPRAVVTPAVRDELRRRNVTLVYDTPAPAQAAAHLRLVLVTAGKRLDPTPLVRALRGEGIRLDQHRSECLIAATDQLAAEMAEPDTLGLLLTRETAAGLCLANRLRGIRAVSGTDAGAVSAAVASVGANLLVVDPAAGSPFQLKQMVTEFCRGGARQCPEVLRERLG